MRRLPASAAALGLALFLGTPTAAFARSEKTLTYSRDQVWPTSVRFLVVDERVKVVEKDPDAGYVMFELRDEGKTFRGSLELVTIVRDNQTSVKFVLQLADRPNWQEVAMLTRLERKLRSELGAPPTPRPKPPPKDPPKDPPKQEPPAKNLTPPPPTEGGPPVSPTP
ncbi:MAG: hypothetical protein AB7O24_16205 [Kofleriaceae bacterium]